MTADDTTGAGPAGPGTVRGGAAGTHPLVIGHRGASGYRPEHTAAAYRLAFALGADAVEPDLVATRDGVLVIRHENEISTTTDVAAHPEFADRRRHVEVDGVRHTGWFTEDFTWAELATLRCRERLGALRPLARSFDDRFRMLRFRDLLDLLDRVAEERDGAGARGGMPGLVAEVKHPTHFAALGLPLEELMAAELRAHGGVPGELTVECFEPGALAEVRRQGVGGDLVYLIEATGAPADRVARDGAAARGYDEDVTDAGLAALAAWRGEAADGMGGMGAAESVVEPGRSAAPDAAAVSSAPLLAGISVHTARLGLDGARPAAVSGAKASPLVESAHRAGLGVFCWTLRAENRFLPKAYRRGRGDAGIGDWHGWFRRVIESGVDGVFTDQPDLALDARASA